MARAIKQGQHIFIAFQDGEAVLDSQLRPRMYKSREQFEKSFPGWRDGKAELVEYAPTLTPPNEWVSVEQAMPPEHETVLCIVSGKPKPNIMLEDAYQLGSWNKADGWIIDEWLDWEGANVTWWMPLPAPPDKDNNVPAKVGGDQRIPLPVLQI